MNELMFCTKCGHEISAESEFCAYCGTRVASNSDPVASRARYERYDEGDPDVGGKAKWEGNVPFSNTSEHKTNNQRLSQQVSCFKCGNMIPADSKYCPVCRVLLFVECPKCGHRYSAQYVNCNECGTNREEYLRLQKEREREELQRGELEEAKRQAESKRLEEERKTQRGANWILIVFLLLFLATVISSVLEWISD